MARRDDNDKTQKRLVTLATDMWPSWKRPGLRLRVMGGSLSRAIIEERAEEDQRFPFPVPHDLE
ncbi:MAG: hypothetical protein HYV26_16885 [Candidatus Hydrogenedentes bacterium]|nr:hypothetical protein [Candidatus Hydrogenedentota bacterium]